METWRTLHTRRILHAPGAIRVHGGFSPSDLEPGPSSQESSTLPTGQLWPEFSSEKGSRKTFKNITNILLSHNCYLLNVYLTIFFS